MVRWKVKARFLLNRNRKILPGALYQGHFTGRLKKALASRVPVTPVETVIKRAPFISDALFPTSLVSYRCLFLSFPLSLSLCLSEKAFFRSLLLFLPTVLHLASPALILFETLTAKSVSMSTFVLFSEGSTASARLLYAFP